MYLCQNAKTGEEQIFGARASEETILKSKHSFDYQTLFDGPLNTELILSCFT